MLDEQKTEVKIEKKVKDKYPEFYEKAMPYGREQLNKEIQILAKGLADNMKAKEEDPDYRDACEEKSRLEKPYRDYKTAAELKIRFCRGRLQELGDE